MNYKVPNGGLINVIRYINKDGLFRVKILALALMKVLRNLLVLHKGVAKTLGLRRVSVRW